MEPLFHTLLSNNADRSMILVAVFSLLLVLLFVYSLHYYVQLFLAQDRDRESAPAPVIPMILGARLYRLRDLITVDGTNNRISLSSPPLARGLDSSVISSIPKFVFKPEEEEKGGKGNGLECVICLSSFESGEIGRRIPSCHHAFHVECIDMWLYSHTTCPTCRAPTGHEGTTPSTIASTHVVDSSSANDHEIDVSNGEEIEMTSNSGENGRMSNEGSSYRLEIIVEVPSIENELNGTYHKKLHPSSNVCP